MRTQLIAQANALLNNSYAPYSGFAVACILHGKNTLIKGVNVENISYGATICAERNAICNMVTQGIDPNEISEIIITSNSDKPTIPCCVCRQVMLEFFKPEIPVLMCAKNGTYVEVSLGDLAPYPFCDEKVKRSG